MSKVRSGAAGVESMRDVVARLETPATRMLRELREQQRVVRDLGGPGAVRDVQAMRRTLGLDRPPVAAPLTTDAAPPTPPSKDARTLRKERAAAAAAKRGEALRALLAEKGPGALLSRLRTLKSKGRKLCHVAAAHGMTADELRSMESTAKATAAPSRKHRKRS